MKVSPSIYSTADLGTATFLFTHDHELVETSMQGPKRLYFHFNKREDTERLVSAYLSGTGQAPAKKLFDNYRSLRALTYAKTDNI